MRSEAGEFLGRGAERGAKPQQPEAGGFLHRSGKHLTSSIGGGSQSRKQQLLHCRPKLSEQGSEFRSFRSGAGALLHALLTISRVAAIGGIGRRQHARHNLERQHPVEEPGRCHGA